MSVADLDKVDMMGFTEGGKCLRMVISDHLDWEDEEAHLWILQDKINAYLALLQDKKWRKKNAKRVRYAEIVVFFVHDMTEMAQKFLQMVQDQLGQHGIKITAAIADDAFREDILQETE